MPEVSSAPPQFGVIARWCRSELCRGCLSLSLLSWRDKAGLEQWAYACKLQSQPEHPEVSTSFEQRDQYSWSV
jgi:hypothetical protein